MALRARQRSALFRLSCERAGTFSFTCRSRCRIRLLWSSISMGQLGTSCLRRLGDLAEEFGFLLLSPASQETTWDAIHSAYGPDVRLIDRALDKVFSRRRVDPRKIAVYGFSDGASYAIGLGISNGDLFRAVIAFSPGFVPSGVERAGRPRILISHGRKDQILPFENTSGQMIPLLKQAGYDLTFREFDGPHTVPPEVARGAMEWFLK